MSPVNSSFIFAPKVEGEIRGQDNHFLRLQGDVVFRKQMSAWLIDVQTDFI